MDKIMANFKFDPTPGEEGDLIMDDFDLDPQFFNSAPAMEEIKESRLGTEIGPKSNLKIEENKSGDMH